MGTLKKWGPRPLFQLAVPRHAPASIVILCLNRQHEVFFPDLNWSFVDFCSAVGADSCRQEESDEKRRHRRLLHYFLIFFCVCF